MRQDGVYARQRFRFARVDLLDQRVRHIRAQRCAEQHAREDDVVGVLRRAGHFRHGIGARLGFADHVESMLRFGQHQLDRLAIGRFDGIHHADVARAAAVCILQRDLDLFVCYRLALLLVEQRLRLHDQTRRAETALHRTVLDEVLLQRVQMAVGYAFNRLNLRALGLQRGIDARHDGLPIDDDRADAAFRFIATDLGAGQSQFVAQHFGQKLIRLHFYRNGLAIDGKV